MAKKDNKESQEVAKWQERISIAKKRLENTASEHQWDVIIKEYKNQYDVSLGAVKAPVINDVYAYVQSTIANINFRDPHVSVNPRKKGTKMGAWILEQAINYYWREMGLKNELDKELMDCILVGHGWHKTGVGVETHGEAENKKVVKENLYSCGARYNEVVFNVGSMNPPYDCMWMAHKVVKPLEEVKEKYSAPGLSGVPHPMFADKKEAKKLQFQDDIMFVVLWEIWDAQTRGKFLIAEDYNRYLVKSTWPKYLDKFPFDILWFNRMPDEPYPMSDIEPWNDQIKEKIKLVGQALNHVKRWNRQMLIQGDLMDEPTMDKFEQGVDGAILKVNGDPNAKTKFTDFGQLPPDIYQLIKVVDNIARIVNGQPEIDKGGVTQTQTRTLGELELIKEGAKSRTDRKIDRLEEHIEAIAKQLIAHIQGDFDIPKIIKITGETPQAIVDAFKDRFNPTTNEIEFSKEDIVGEYDVDVKAGSTLPLNKQAKTIILDNILKNLAPALEAAKASPFVHELVYGLVENFDMPQLKEAFEQEMLLAEQQAKQQAKDAALERGKAYSETEKRLSQAAQIDTETEVMKIQGVEGTVQEMIKEAEDAAKSISGNGEKS